jgi:hypothetical protein
MNVKDLKAGDFFREEQDWDIVWQVVEDNGKLYAQAYNNEALNIDKFYMHLDTFFKGRIVKVDMSNPKDVIMRNFGYARYTYLHRLALKHYISKNDNLTPEETVILLERADVHDMDKLTLYLFWEKEEASKYHRKTSRHHMRKEFIDLGFANKFDMLESIFDFECAGLTKPDKPLNAFDTIEKFYPDCKEAYMKYLPRLGMDFSYKAFDEDDLKWFEEVQEVTDKMVLDEITRYLWKHKENVFTVLEDGSLKKEDLDYLVRRPLKYR